MMTSNHGQDRPGPELPADRLLGPAIFFVLGVTLALLGIRGSPTASELAPGPGVAAPPRALDAQHLRSAPIPESAEWVLGTGDPDGAGVRTEPALDDAPVAEIRGVWVAPASPAARSGTGGGGTELPAATGCGTLGVPGRAPPAPVPSL